MQNAMGAPPPPLRPPSPPQPPFGKCRCLGWRGVPLKPATADSLDCFNWGLWNERTILTGNSVSIPFRTQSSASSKDVYRSSFHDSVTWDRNVGTKSPCLFHRPLHSFLQAWCLAQTVLPRVFSTTGQHRVG